MPITRAGVADLDEVLRALRTDRGGLSEQEVLRRRATVGPNAVHSHHAPRCTPRSATSWSRAALHDLST